MDALNGGTVVRARSDRISLIYRETESLKVRASPPQTSQLDTIPMGFTAAICPRHRIL